MRSCLRRCCGRDRLRVAAVVIVRGGITVAVASPQYETPSNSVTVTVDMATQRHYGLADFKPQFAAQGITLRRMNVLSGVSWYGDTRAGKGDDGFLITAYPQQGKVMFGRHVRPEAALRDAAREPRCVLRRP
jgi:hypothetical protein